MADRKAGRRRRGLIGILTCAAVLLPPAAVAQEEQEPPAGEVLIRQCLACHTLAKGAPDGVGPNLFGVVGRKAATRKGFAYSPGLRSKGVVWNAEQLDAFLAGPAGYVPGTRMAFSGLSDPAERRAVIDYLTHQR